MLDNQGASSAFVTHRIKNRWDHVGAKHQICALSSAQIELSLNGRLRERDFRRSYEEIFMMVEIRHKHAPQVTGTQCLSKSAIHLLPTSPSILFARRSLTLADDPLVQGEHTEPCAALIDP